MTEYNLKFWKNHCYYCNKVTQNKTIYIKVTYNKKRQLCDYCYNVYIKNMITYKKRFKTLELYYKWLRMGKPQEALI